jgi:hypothetical protein
MISHRRFKTAPEFSAEHVQGADAFGEVLGNFLLEIAVIGRAIHGRKDIEPGLLQDDGHFLPAFFQVSGCPCQVDIGPVTVDHLDADGGRNGSRHRIGNNLAGCEQGRRNFPGTALSCQPDPGDNVLDGVCCLIDLVAVKRPVGCQALVIVSRTQGPVDPFFPVYEIDGTQSAQQFRLQQPHILRVDVMDPDRYHPGNRVSIDQGDRGTQAVLGNLLLEDPEFIFPYCGLGITIGL